MPAPASAAATLLPRPVPPPAVTIISGFLGAGKTTLLQQLLAQAAPGASRPWAAVVNDLASLNIDGRLIERAGASRVVELANGCVCCTVRDELAETIAELTASGRYAHILVESSGVAEPRRLAGLFLRANEFGRKLSDFAQLHALVTVVDAAQWLEAWRGLKRARAACDGRPPAGAHAEVDAVGLGAHPGLLRAGAAKAPAELMLEQVECADLLILNKRDLVSAAELAELRAALRGLNARADILTTREAQLPAGLLPGARRFDEAATLGAARWLRVLGGDSILFSNGEGAPPASARASLLRGLPGPAGAAADAATPSLPWRTLVFRERRPFVEVRLREFFAARRPLGLLRAKGFFWLQERPAEMGYLSLAGEVLRWDSVGTWAAALLERGAISHAEVPKHAHALWAAPYGDRRQELVFIGLGFDAAELERALRRCLTGT